MQTGRVVPKLDMADTHKHSTVISHARRKT